MDLSNKIPSPNSGRSDSQRKSSKTVMKIPYESNENSFTPDKISISVPHIAKNEPKSLKSPSLSPSSHKRILAEKNDLPNSSKKYTPQRKTDKPIPACVNGSMPDSPYPVPYDPVTNYTLPRPEFLRYDPNRRTEIMLRVEAAMLDEEEEEPSQSTSSISTSSQMPVEKAMQEEGPSLSPSSISTAPQLPVCGVEMDLSDDEEEGISYAKLALKLVFFLVCLVSSVGYICYVSSNVEMKLHSRRSEVNVLGEMIGLSKMCLSRRNAELTCGIEERDEVSVRITPKEVDGFKPEDTVRFPSSESEVRKENGVITDIGSSAQENIVESPEVELHSEGDTQLSSIKMQVYLLGLMHALACLSVFVEVVISMHNNISKKFYKKKKQKSVNELLASETGVKKGSVAGQISADKMSPRIGGKSNMYAIQPPQVELLGEFSFHRATSVKGGSVEEMDMQAKRVTDASMVKGSSFKEVQLQSEATNNSTTTGTILEKENKIQGEATKTGVTHLRRSSRRHTQLTSP